MPAISPRDCLDPHGYGGALLRRQESTFDE
jgi:hypothetical protein